MVHFSLHNVAKSTNQKPKKSSEAWRGEAFAVLVFLFQLFTLSYMLFNLSPLIMDREILLYYAQKGKYRMKNVKTIYMVKLIGRGRRLWEKNLNLTLSFSTYDSFLSFELKLKVEEGQRSSSNLTVRSSKTRQSAPLKLNATVPV